jgi:hypothetical protein
VSATARHQTLATLAIAGLFGAAITYGLLPRDTPVVAEAAAAPHHWANLSATNSREGVAGSGARTDSWRPGAPEGRTGPSGCRSAPPALGATRRLGRPTMSRSSRARCPRCLPPATVGAAIGVPLLVNE